MGNVSQEVRTALHIKTDAQLDALYRGSIIAGPFTLPAEAKPDPTPFTSGQQGVHIFLICTTNQFGQRDSTSGSYLYELGQVGKVLTITPLPRPIDAPPIETGGSLVLPMASDSVLQVKPSADHPVYDMGPFEGENDFVGNVASLANLQPPLPDAWMTTAKESTELVSGVTFALRPVGRPYISSKESRTINFPVGIASLINQGSRVGNLVVSLSEPQKFPTTNYLMAADRVQVLSSGDVHVERVENIAGAIRFVVAFGEKKWFFDFPIDQISDAIRTS